MRINSVAVTHAAGTNFPIPSGDNGSFTSTYQGTYDVEIDFTTSIPGQNISFMDSDLNITCQNTIGTGGTFGILGATINTVALYVTAADGSCS